MMVRKKTSKSGPSDTHTFGQSSFLQTWCHIRFLHMSCLWAATARSVCTAFNLHMVRHFCLQPNMVAMVQTMDFFILLHISEIKSHQKKSQCMLHFVLLSSFLICALGWQISITAYFNGQCAGGGVTETYVNGACNNITGPIPSSNLYSCTGGYLMYSDFATLGCVGNTTNITYTPTNQCVQYTGFGSTLSEYITCTGNSITMNRIFGNMILLQIVFVSISEWLY